MEIIYGRKLTEQEEILCQQIAFECNILKDTARLLLYRNIDSVEKAKAFLSPGKKGFNNPFLLSDMEDAVNRIYKAKNCLENVLIFGDYDADGICATAVLYNCLQKMGIKVSAVIPEREEGYGLNTEKIRVLNDLEKIDLLITVDCGISDGEKIEEIKAFGIDVIVTDHHETPPILPDCIKINPKIPGQRYPFTGLCGAGVAYKLAKALIGDEADEFLDFTALATVADSMELIDENRDIVVEGLKIFNSSKLRPQFKCLIGDTNRSVTAQTLAYNISPRINAGGRMGEAGLALKLFLSEDEKEIFEYTTKLSEYNLLRQVECDVIYKQAREKIINENLEQDGVILVADDSWKTGFIGIVAAKLVEDFSRPVIVFAGHDGYFKGSARSVDRINIYDAISYCAELLIGFGGHSQAAGVAVSKENFHKLSEVMNEYILSRYGKRDLTKKVYAEWHIEQEFSMRFAKEIERLEPFGVGNKKPVFTTEAETVLSLPLKKGSQHFTFKTTALDILDFNGASNVFTLGLPVKKKILFEPNLSTFKNVTSLKGYARCVVPSFSDATKLRPYFLAEELNRVISTESNECLKQASCFEDVGLCKNTVFVCSDPNVIEKYKELVGLPIYYFEITSKSSSNCIAVCPKNLPNGFSRVVYLNKPLATLDFKGEQIVLEQGYLEELYNLSVDRQDFSNVYQKLRNLNGKLFRNVAEFCQSNFDFYELNQAVFCLTVFLELGIFFVKDECLHYDSKVINPLTNSKVYSKIYLLNEIKG